MGYRTIFNGHLYFDKPVEKTLKQYINNFQEIRHMKRDVSIIKEIDPEWETHCFDGKLGYQGEYYVPVKNDKVIVDFMDKSIISYNDPADTVPGLWLDWMIDENDHLVWNNAEKFYGYIDWLEYLITHFFAPKGYHLNGEIFWRGENFNDYGSIAVKDNDIWINLPS